MTRKGRRGRDGEVSALSVTFARAARAVVRRERALASVTARFPRRASRQGGNFERATLAGFVLVDAELAGRRVESANLRLTRSHVVFLKIWPQQFEKGTAGQSYNIRLCVFRLSF